jgi:ubiquinone/menaquinone biosynthesis C-methylase UbiE
VSRAPGVAAEHVKAQAEAHFQKWALYYDRSSLNELVFLPSVRRCMEEITRWQAARGPRPFRMLDVGCGTGTLLSVVARDPLAEQLVGLDYAGEMVRRAAGKFGQIPQAEKLSAVRGDAERLPFADASFDVVTCCNSFHHYPHQPVAIAAFRRVLKPGGLLVLIDGFRDAWIGWLIFDVAVATVEGHVHHVPWTQMREMLTAGGFRELRQEKMNIFAPLLVNVALA